MGSQAIEVALDMLPRPGTVESSRTPRRRSLTAVGASILLLVAGAADDGRCGDSKIRTQDLAVSIETRGSDAAQSTAVQPPESGPTWERRQAVEREQERDRAEALARTLTSSLRAELDAIQSTEEATRIKQRQALNQERERADALARELATLRADTARIVSKEAAQAIDLGIRQTEALEQQRDKAADLARELSFVREELEVTRTAVSKAVQAAESESRQEPAPAIERDKDKAENLMREVAALRAELDAARTAASVSAKTAPPTADQTQALDRERARADAFARDLSSLRADAAKATAAEIEQRQASEQELKQQRDGAEALARELTRLRAELDTARGVAQEAAQSIEAVRIEQKKALQKERDSAETLARELASVRDQRDAGHRQLAALKASSAFAAVDDGLPAWVATSRPVMAEVRPTIPQQTSIQAPVSAVQLAAAPEAKLPAVQSTAHERAPDLESNVSTASAQSTPASASPRSLIDEQRLLARASALLQQADISGARSLLEHAAQRGSARAAFMLAETYDERVLQSWLVRGISGDTTKARELYKLAQAGGIEDAKERIKKLQQP